MVLHKTPERKISEKRETTTTTTKSVTLQNRQTTHVNTKQITLPQMTNNFMVKTDAYNVRTTASETLQTSRSFVCPPGRINQVEISRITKIYLSEKQSGVVRDCGMDIPCAPPATPLPGELKLAWTHNRHIDGSHTCLNFLFCDLANQIHLKGRVQCCASLCVLVGGECIGKALNREEHLI